ncbi:ALP1-like protein [Tanacetum coccineum]
MSSDLFFYTSSDDEDEVNNELAMFTEACQAAYEASKPKLQQTPVERDRYSAHDRLVMAYFSEHPQDDCTGKVSISSLIKCTSAIRQMAYEVVPDSLDEYLEMGATTARDSLRIFYWSWANCPVAYRAQFCRDDGLDPFLLLEAVASNDLWIWHAFFGVSGMNNDVNVLRQSPLFNDLKSGRAPDVPFVANNVPYKRGYYLTGGIYPQWKDVERAFGVLKQKWKLIKYPARGMSRSRLSDVMYTCIILHNMIIHDNGEAISPEFFLGEQHRDDDPVRIHEESL